MVVVLDIAVLWVQMGQPPAQRSGVDVEGTRRAALPIVCCPSVSLSVLLPAAARTCGPLLLTHCWNVCPGLLSAGEKHSVRGLTNLGIPCVCWGSPHGRGSVSEGWSANDGQGLAD